jgi:hypothetical protein
MSCIVHVVQARYVYDRPLTVGGHGLLSSGLSQVIQKCIYHVIVTFYKSHLPRPDHLVASCHQEVPVVQPMLQVTGASNWLGRQPRLMSDISNIATEHSWQQPLPSMPMPHSSA